MAEDEGRIKRWHRRKVAVRQGTPETEVDVAALHPDGENLPTVAPDHDDSAEDGTTTDVPDLPDIDSLDAESDFSVFMGEGVPEELKNLALRKLWRLDPIFANVDGLVDYGEDFTDAATVIEGMKTAYRIGKGMLTDEEVAARDAVGKPTDEDKAEDPVEGEIETAADDSEEPEPIVEEPAEPEETAGPVQDSDSPPDPHSA